MFVSISDILPATVDDDSEVLVGGGENIGKLIGKGQARLNREIPQTTIGHCPQTGR